MKHITLILILFCTTSVFAQRQQDSVFIKVPSSIRDSINMHQLEIESLTKKLKYQNYTLGRQAETIAGLEREDKNLRISLDSLNLLVEANKELVVANTNELDSKIQMTGQNAESQITDLDHTLDRQQLYWVIAILAMLLLGVLIYWLLGKRIMSNKTDVETQIRNTKASLEEEGVKLDNKLVEVLESQLKLQQESKTFQAVETKDKVNHSLALKIADEIIRIQKNLSRMDQGTKGLKQLNSSVKRIQDNFASNGYELVDMLGKEYNEGMKATVNFIQNEDYEKDQRLITRVIKPQVNYQGKMIQTAQVEVTEG
ncbi:hypothetical protein D2V08_13920 [Flagellimonas lutimaris]|uniref:Septum formation initiator n=2 Tax=Flagellimonas lutimaris TaxID=475082 RepID=A0A3A1N7Y5_9FLAO|nr:hypothetical protein D2V08_13920 [Allomuricauda lutimaris]